MNATVNPPSPLARQVWTRAGAGVVLVAALLFGTAGTFAYWQAWVYLVVLFTPLLGFVAYYLRHDPALLARRMEARERNATQRWVVLLASLPYLLAFSLPGLGVRFGWPQVAPPLVFVGDGVVLAAYGLFIAVMHTNRYAARTVRVEAGQQVITSGPYRWVRHPMYIAAILMTVFSPLALGSAWAMLPALLIVPVLMVRIVDEEKVLVAALPGYTAYTTQTPYRLIPFLW